MENLADDWNRHIASRANWQPLFALRVDDVLCRTRFGLAIPTKAAIHPCIAAETSGRHCLAVELDPAYVDVAVQRWQAFTGKEAVLEGTGETFASAQAERQQAEVDA